MVEPVANVGESQLRMVIDGITRKMFIRANRNR